MLGKIRFILVLLLFAAVCALCRIQAARYAESFGGKTFLVQQTTSHDCGASRFCGHTCLVPDVMNEVQSPGSDQKIPAKYAAIPSHSLLFKPVFGDISRRNAIIPHPGSTDYYIFSLEKIRI